MKIGLIGINIYAKFLNFACQLHTLAFQEFLKHHGYDVQVIDYKPVYYGNFDMEKPHISAERNYIKAVRRLESRDTVSNSDISKVQKLKEIYEGYYALQEERIYRYAKFSSFASKHLNLTDDSYDSDLLEIKDPGFDCYICVTDVIWQYIDKYKFDRGFFLACKTFNGKGKIAYAASRGASQDTQGIAKKTFLSYLKDFDAISVREEDFKKFISDNSDVKVTTVLDPVLLHDESFWNNYCLSPSVNSGYIVLYYVMEQAKDTINAAVEYAKEKNLIIVELSDRPTPNGRVVDPDVVHIFRYDIGMEEWLGYIRDAEAVFTNSFHGCCFSVIFEKQLFVGKRNGNKVPNFLKMFGLQNRQLVDGRSFKDIETTIDYIKVKDIVENKRRHSIRFLTNALSEVEGRLERSDAYSGLDSRSKEILFPIKYHSGREKVNIIVNADVLQKHKNSNVAKLSSGSYEVSFKNVRVRNDGAHRLPSTLFLSNLGRLVGWHVRFKVDNAWFWMSDDGPVIVDDPSKEGAINKLLVRPNGLLPYLPVNHITVCVLEAQWHKQSISVSENDVSANSQEGNWQLMYRSLEKSYRNLINSKSWRVTEPARKLMKIVRKLIK